MSKQDPISDMLTSIINAQKANLSKVRISYSKLTFRIAEILALEGYLKRLETIKNKMTQKELKKDFQVDLKYHKGKSAIEKVERISKPGLRVYIKSKDLPKGALGGLSIISTSYGIMCHIEASEKQIGGELICKIF